MWITGAKNENNFKLNCILTIIHRRVSKMLVLIMPQKQAFRSWYLFWLCMFDQFTIDTIVFVPFFCNIFFFFFEKDYEFHYFEYFANDWNIPSDSNAYKWISNFLYIANGYSWSNFHFLFYILQKVKKKINYIRNSCWIRWYSHKCE